MMIMLKYRIVNKHFSIQILQKKRNLINLNKNSNKQKRL